MPGTKRCTGCGRDLPLDAYSPHGRAADGRNSRCRDCRAADAHGRRTGTEPWSQVAGRARRAAAAAARDRDQLAAAAHREAQTARRRADELATEADRLRRRAAALDAQAAAERRAADRLEAAAERHTPAQVQPTHTGAADPDRPAA